jgi:hypothetical protein
MGNLLQEDDRRVARLSTHRHHRHNLSHQLLIKNLARVMVGAQQVEGLCKVNKVGYG